MSKINRKNELLERAEPLRAKSIAERTHQEHFTVNRADILLESIALHPGLEWTFDLAPGTQLYVTGEPTEQDWGPKIGDILILNHCTGFRDILGCNNADGLGTSVHRARVRLAKPTDPGYKGTIDEWHAILRADNDWLRRESFIGWALALAFLGALLIKSV